MRAQLRRCLRRPRRGAQWPRVDRFRSFKRRFPTRRVAPPFWSERRWPEGFVCPGCGEQRAAALKSRAYTYECLDCGRQTSATAGTVMHRSKLPLTAWFWAARLMSTHSNGMSARQLEDQLGLTYRTAWLLTQKLRRSMVVPDRAPLEGVVEVDQAEIPFRAGDSFFDPGNAGKILIAGAVEVIDRDMLQGEVVVCSEMRSGAALLSGFCVGKSRRLEHHREGRTRPVAPTQRIAAELEATP